MKVNAIYASTLEASPIIAIKIFIFSFKTIYLISSLFLPIFTSNIQEEDFKFFYFYSANSGTSVSYMDAAKDGNGY